MPTESWARVWERVRTGKHVVVLGPGALPPSPSDLTVIRVPCTTTGPSELPLDSARRQVAQLLGEAIPTAAAERMVPSAGPRHRLLGETPGPSLDLRFVEACNRLATWPQHRVVLAFESIDRADEATVSTLSHLLQRPGMLQLPLLLTVHSAPQGLVAELVYLIGRDDAEAAIISIAAAAATPEDHEPYDWTALPPDVLRVLRAAAVMGNTFDATLLARLINEPLGLVLEKLQWAVDAGVPLTDQGQGHLVLPAALTAELQRALLPSLRTFWHARLGELLGQAPQGEQAAPPAAPSEWPRSAPASTSQAQHPLRSYADLFTAPQDRPAPPASTRPDTQADGAPQGEAPQGADTAVPPPPAPSDPLRAAAHMQAAGRPEEAVGHYLTAVREAMARGDTRRAYSVIAQAMQLLDTLPHSGSRGLLRAQLWLERGRLQWHGALVGAPFTLRDALASLEQASAALPREVPLDLMAQMATVTAGIYYDLGDQDSLAQALKMLMSSGRAALNAGQPLLAAQLLNDQAAVYIRLGDPASATQLLAQSRAMFEQRLGERPTDPMALEELADSDHLLARLPLHMGLRPGREAEAYERGLAHARAAAQAYQRLGQPRQLARVWETMSRLSQRQGRLQEAYQLLAPALELQQQLGDVTGLARSTAALADLCVQTGQLGDAVNLLSQSMRLNADKGSPIGLAFNRHTLHILRQAAAPLQGPDAEHVRDTLSELEQQLTRAEEVIGKVELPHESPVRPASSPQPSPASSASASGGKGSPGNS